MNSSSELNQGWFKFRKKWLKPQYKIIALLVPFLAQAILLLDLKFLFFSANTIGLISMHLAYWGSLIITISIAIGSFLIPKLISEWNELESLEIYLEKPATIQRIDKISTRPSAKNKIFMDDIEKKKYFLNKSNLHLKSFCDNLHRAIIGGQVLLAISSALTALRVSLAIPSIWT